MKKSVKILFTSLLLVSAPAFAKAADTKVQIKQPHYEFIYSYPSNAAKIPVLKAKLDKDLAAEKKDLIYQVAQAKKEASPGDRIEYYVSKEWQVVTDIPNWLSLSGLYSTDFGGAHPNYSFVQILWNKQANKEIKFSDLFNSPQAFKNAINTKFCSALNAEQAKRRGEPVNPNSGQMYDGCVDPLKSHIILGSSNKATFDRIGVLIDPYEAGPYAEGNYEINLKVTPEVLAVVKPQYKASFSLSK